MRRTFAVLSVAFLALAPLACRSGPLAGAFATASPHEKYEDSLRDAGLAQTALGFEWLRAGREALARPIPVSLPFRETGYFAPERPGAAAYRFDLARGQRLIVDLTWQSSEKPARLFLDLFEAADPEESPRRVASLEPDVPRLTFDAGRGGAYLLRLQPEMLRGGRYTVTQRAAASLSFPVEGKDSRALQSGFGDPRDGGGRTHEGVDIFAPSPPSRRTRSEATSSGSGSRNATSPSTTPTWTSKPSPPDSGSRRETPSV